MSEKAEDDPDDAPLAKAIEKELVRLMGEGLSKEHQEQDEAVRRLVERRPQPPPGLLSFGRETAT